jgi:hypothetical protein
VLHIRCDGQAEFLLKALYSSSSISSILLEISFPSLNTRLKSHKGKGLRVPRKSNLILAGLRLNKTWQDFQGLEPFFS